MDLIEQLKQELKDDSTDTRSNMSYLETLSTEIKAALYERVSDKLFRSFALVFVLHNWVKIAAGINLIFNNSPIDFDLYKAKFVFTWGDLLIPLILALIFCYGYPLLKAKLVYWSEKLEANVINERNRGRKVRLLTEQESKDLYRDLERVQRYQHSRGDIEAENNKLKEEMVFFYQEVMRLGFNINSHGNGKLSFIKSPYGLEEGMTGLIHEGRLISIATAESERISVDVNQMAFVIRNIGSFSLVASNDTTFLSFDKTYTHWKTYKTPQSETLYVDEIGATPAVTQLKKLSDNVFNVQFQTKSKRKN